MSLSELASAYLSLSLSELTGAYLIHLELI
jgi:hypothetical protein